MALQITGVLVTMYSLLVLSETKPLTISNLSAQNSHVPESFNVLDYLLKYGYLEKQAEPLPEESESKALLFRPHSNTERPSLYQDMLEDMELPNTLVRAVNTEQRNQGFKDEHIRSGVAEFQAFMKLDVTGELDQVTINTMLSPRCGMKDKRMDNPFGMKIRRNPNARSRRRRFATQGSKWINHLLYYHISAWSTKISDQALVKHIIEQAFRAWAEVSPLVFRWSNSASSADIIISFATGDHGDGQSFDGPGGILAHAFFPTYGGAIHFDDDEPWNTAPTTGIDLMKVALHEIGHSLGLKHSSVSDSVMFAIYTNNNPGVYDLHADDINGIQHIYGECQSTIDSIFSWFNNGYTYIFKDSNYWRFEDSINRTATGYPKTISTGWLNVPSDGFDTVLAWDYNWVTYFFKGQYYYRYSDLEDKVAYINLISSGWVGVPDDLDAAFSWNDATSYFFKGTNCYKFDNHLDRVVSGYPRPISQEWPGIPDNLDTVFKYRYDGGTYFFKGPYYYTWDDQNGQALGPYLIRSRWRQLCTV